jgi:AhpD family alkylhydroperoxidase
MTSIEQVPSAIDTTQGPQRAPAQASAAPGGGHFGGFRKRTMTALEFVASTVSLVPDLGTFYRIWVRRDLDPGFREELMVAVARQNECRYCSWAHLEWAGIAGVADEDLAKLEQMDPAHFDRRKWIAICFVRELVTARFGCVPADLMQEMQASYTDREIREITFVAKAMDMANRAANTWDAMRARWRGKPAADSRIFDELVLSAVFLLSAPLIVLFLARATKRPFFAMARSLIDYTRHEPG